MADKNKTIQVQPNLLDRAIRAVAPGNYLRRIRSRLLIKTLENSGYVAGSYGKKSMRSWTPNKGDTDSDDVEGRDLIVSRSRDAYRNIPLAGAALKRIVTNAIGPGLMLQCQIKRDVLGLDDTAADTWERDVEQRFNAYATSKSADLTRNQNFYESQALAFLSFLMSGDCFAVLTRKKRSDLDNDLRFKIFESDFVSNENGSMDTAEITGGVKVGKDGETKSFFFSKYHPGATNVVGNKWTEIDMFSASGRRQVIHLFKMERPGQRRGTPILAPVMEALKQLGRYTESELMAAVITSFFTAFIKQQTKTENPLQEAVPTEQKVTDQNQSQDMFHYEMGSGNVVGMADGEDVVFADPKRPASGFDAFFQSICRMIGANLELPFELLILHFTSSYSASRAAILEAWKTFKNYRSFIGINYNQIFFEEWLFWEVFDGRIIAPGFMEDNYLRYAWSGTTWQGAGMGQLDPVKETKAAVEKIKNNLSDWENEFQKSESGDWESAMKRKSRQTQFIKDHGIEPPPAGPGRESPDEGDGEERPEE